MKLENPSSHSSDSPAKTNHFFKIILSDAHSQTKLMIPRRFVRKYGMNLDSRISLKVPNGLAWRVSLETRKGDVWLQNGWPEFARFYSLKYGHLLVFKYQGHCDFKVRIFDSSSTEIDYPSSKSAKLNIRESSQMGKRAIEIDHSTSSDLIRPRKKRVTNPALKDASHNGVSMMRKLQQERTKLGDCASATKEVETRALALAEAFKSDNPFFFHVMRRTYIDGKGRGLVVKKAFEETYRNWKDNDQVHLQVAGRIWLVNCAMNHNSCRLSSGWDKFARDNTLSVGDVCVFELVDACRILLQVVIYRATKETNGKENKILPRVRSEAKHARVLTSVNAFTSKYPFFKVRVCPSSFYGASMTVPQKFIKRYITKDCCSVTLQTPEGKTWLVKCNVYKSGTKFGVGWRIFARANRLAVGDVCAFELIDFSEKLLNVVIFRNKSSDIK